MSEDIEERALRYASRRGIQLEHRLGYGKDGTIFSTNIATAIKIHRRRTSYEREHACYRRLAEHKIIEVRGHHVPQLIGWDDELLVVEMTIVQSPYLLDFVDVHFDETPDFPDEVIEAWHEQKREEFSEQRWEAVQLVLATLRGRYGIHLFDVHPGNITFGPGDDE